MPRRTAFPTRNRAQQSAEGRGVSFRRAKGLIEVALLIALGTSVLFSTSVGAATESPILTDPVQSLQAGKTGETLTLVPSAAAPQSETVNGLSAVTEENFLPLKSLGAATPGALFKAPSGKIVYTVPSVSNTEKAEKAAPLEADTENVVATSKEEPEIAAVSQASELVYGYTDFGWPSKTHPLRVGLVRYASPAPLEGLIDATVSQLKNFFGEDALRVQTYSLKTLSDAVHLGEVDIFIASSGLYRRLVLEGARDLATGLSKTYPDPNKSEAVAMVVLDGREDLQTVADLQGRRLVSSIRGGFTGYDIPMGELVKEGYDPNTFFASEKFLGDGPAIGGAFEELKNYHADVAFFRLCLLENYLSEHPEDKGRYRVIHNVTAKGEVCQRSTDLYPVWTVATTARTDPRLSRLVTRALLQMPPAGKNGFYWGVATDYSSVDQLFERLHVGPYRYLDDWTLEKIWEEAKGWVFAILLALALLVSHSLRVGYLVRIRTQALTEALEEQKKLEVAAREAGARIDRLEKMGAVAQLSSIFAHEMRQPLSAISLYLFALKRAIGKVLSGKEEGAEDMSQETLTTLEKTSPILEKLFRETERANSIVERVRLYAKADRPPRDAVSIRALVGKAVNDLKLSARFKGEITLQEGDDAILTVDALGLELVFVNLLKNGLEAASEKPVAHVRVTMRKDDSALSIAFEDNGPVLSVESQAALLGSLSTTKPTGLGLGLSIVRGILEAHSAGLTYRFKEEGGVVALVTLPLREANEAEEAQMNEEKA